MICLKRIWRSGLLVLVFQCVLIASQGPGPGPGKRSPKTLIAPMASARTSMTTLAEAQMQSRAVDTRVTLEIPEGQPRGTVVGSIPTKPGFTYRFNENPREFHLNASTGEITTTAVLDRESLRNDRYDLVVLSSQPTYPIEVRIVVIDMNDNSPEFPESSIEVSFSESANTGTRLILDTATDKDSGVNGVSTNYRIVDGNEDEKFKLLVTTNPSGETSYLHMETTGKLDRETKAFYQLNISAQDGGTPPRFGYLQVNVTILDVNDNPPIFDHSDYIVSLNESVPPGTSVLQVMATDSDIGDNAKITYYLADTETQFTVDPETGVISTADTLNCQQNCPHLNGGTSGCPKSCVFTVFARDHGTPRQDGRTYVTVNLVDANDHDPIVRFRYFPPTAGFATVDENAQNGSVVAAVSVIDFDEGLNGETTVEIRAGNELNHFRLEYSKSFDIVRVNGVLDREEINKYNLTIVATDKGTPPRSSTTFLIIYVNDVNDHEPVFEKSEYSAILSELVPVGTYVAGITATDEDTGVNSNIYYAFVSGNEHQWFDIDVDSGLITTKGMLDREVQGTVQLKISARDGGPNPKWAYTQLKVTILDENDEKPEFAQSSINVSLSESTPPNTLVAMLTALDHDQGTNGSVTYSLQADVDQNYPNMFALDSMTGQLTTKTKLDRETISEYEIKVIAKDQGIPPQSSTATVYLFVEDVNDNSPEFYPQQYFVPVDEEVPVGAPLLQVTASDEDEGDNAMITYSIASGGDGLFHVDEKSGEVSLKAPITNFQKSLYRLKITAKDKGDRKAVEDAVVEIIKSHDMEHLNFDTYGGYHFQIRENHEKKEPSIGREVGRVRVNDKVSRNVRYSIVFGDPKRTFHINANTGIITTANRIDREQVAGYYLTVVARSGLAYGSVPVNITILDENDNQPMFAREKEEAKLNENAPVGHEVYVARAVDRDAGVNSRITYSLTDSAGEQFRIAENTGVIYLNKPIRAEPGTVLHLEVMATDSGVRSLSSRHSVSVLVEDVNDHTPVFDHTSYETSLLESTPVNDRFFALFATDVDLGPNGRISYEITEGNSVGKFGVFPDGYLYVKSSLDREERDYYSLVVTARDHGNPPRSSAVPVVIHVIDENDNKPEFTNSTFKFHIRENEPPDTFVGKLTATDLDIGRNAELTFSIVTTQNDFVIDPKNGFIKSLHYFDRESLVQTSGQNFITLEAAVADNGVNRLKDKVKVNIYITDVNDNAPKFLRTPYKVQVSEATSTSSQVLRVFTVDIDDGLNGDVFYTIVGGNEDRSFEIDEATGQITLARALDRETTSSYELAVAAYDAGESVTLSATTKVYIDVLDENDNAPEFTQTESQITILETTPVNTELIQFRATDNDLGINKEVTFSIAAGNRRDTFHVDATTGTLYLHKPVDYEELSVYYLNITASDGGNPRLSTTVPFTVKIEDYNDNPPVFPNTAIVRQIQEGIPVKTPIVTVTAEDPDSGVNGKVSYAIVKQEPEGRHFGINPSNGVIHTLRPIDREFADTFRLTVVATDQAVPETTRLSAEKLVTVIVEDINDNAPFFTSMNTAILPKPASKESVVMYVHARDLDSSTNGLVTYELVSGNTDLFSLHRSTGALTLKRNIPDPEIRYQLTVKATDEAVQTQRKSTEAYVTLIASSSSDAGGPVFGSSEPYAGRVYENEPVGTSVLTVNARLPSNTLAGIEYYLTNVTARGKQVDRLFDIDTKLGVLSTAAVLDREGGSDIYEVEVYAIIASSPTPHTQSTKIRVNVLDKNDSPPSFADTTLTYTVSEDLPTGQVVAKVKATDPDTLGQLTYVLVDGGEGKFEMGSATGVLRLKDTLDREAKDTYHLKIRASDGQQHQDTVVTIKVTDTNDNPPIFKESAYSFDIPENTPRGSRVGKVTAHDDDEDNNGQVTYTVISDWANDVFSLNPQTGVFTLTSRLDYEEVQHYIFVVQAQDTGKPSLSSTLTVYFNVVDLNDNTPLFDPMSYSKEIYENMTVGTSVVAVSATDLDSGDNGRIAYSISSGNEDEDFHIAQNGTIYTVRSLNRENKSFYNLIVTARDQANPTENRLSSTVQVTIVLKDVNDMAPEFITPNETAVLENIPMGTVVMAVKAVDKDEGRNSYIEYSLDTTPEDMFVLGPVDGLLRVSGRLDRETRTNYTLKVTARDRGDPPRSSTTRILVRVLDENDNSPVFDPKQYSASVAENASIGVSVLQVSATDVDEALNGRVRYVIVAGDKNRDFAISEDTGIIRVAKNLNYERKNHYLLTIQAEDTGDDVRYDSAALSISVTDINDNPPTFLDSPYIAYVMENMDDLPASVVTVSAYDADTTPYNQVRYFIKEGDNNLFKINASSGEITLHRSLDREERAEYVLTLVAMDTGTPPLTGTGTVKIVVQDMNDHSPEFERQIYTASVLENQPADTPVVQPVALDKDSGLNARIMYSLVGTLSERFKVDELSGLVTTAVPLDREERDVYHLTLVARDSSVTEPRSTTANVTILVMDQNDNAPSFSEEKYNVHIPDKTQPGQFVFGAKAVDEDINQNSKIVYYLSGRDADKFYMNQETGVIKSSQELVGENSVFLLQIQATDGGKEPRSAMADLEVRLKPANLFPNISLQKQTFSFSEDMENQVITRVKASSPKRGDAGVIQYLIAGGNVGNAFRIDNRTGEVIVGEGLDYETSPVYEVWIEARDSDDPPLRSVVQLNINVTDSNDNAPVLDYFLYNATILEEELPPQKVIQIHATDADSGKNSQVLYQLKQNGDTDNAFTLDAKTGDIYTNIKLDREAIGSYSLTVEAVDQGTPQRTGTATVLITVLDKNDNPPRFTRLFSVNVTENAEIGTFVIQVTSSDLDIGENANASYSFTDNPSEKFHIDPLTGNVTVTGMLDRESQDEYLLKVAAVDGSWRAETPLTITIQDQNDNSPEFEHSYYSFNFPELQRNVAFVGQVTATDRDKQGPNSVISYSLKHPSDFFTVDPASGEIFSKQSMRYKHTTLEPSPENQYVLTVIATDNGKPPMSSECMVTINVVDANNNAPKFEEENYFTPVPESASVGQKVLQLRAKDEGDFGVNAELEYVKIGGNGSELFNVGKTSGWITVAYSLHGKRMKQYSLIVRAVDKGVPPQQDEAIITLVITGENRYTPVFTALSYQVIVPENEPLGSTIVTVTATDNDDGPNGMVRYSISSGNEREEFAVNSKTGAVTIRHPLDYDIIQEYHLNITAKDLGFQMRHTTAMLTVTLTDINDNAPTFNQSSYKAYLAENSPPKTFVYKVRAVDIDSAKNAIVQYSLVGGSGKELFTINTNTGEIFSKISFDYEEKSLYSLDILAANPGSTMYGSTKVEVYISGENEFYPKFIQPVFHFSVSESASVGTSVGTIQATDQDAGDDGNVYYLFVGSSNDRGFTIGSETGVISVARKLDRETQNRVVLTVMAKNYGGIRGNDTDEAQVIISIQDGNDPPEFLEPVYEAKISEGVPVGSKVTTVTAVDKDVRPKNNQFAYSIIGGNIGKVFKVDPQTGDIETTSKLDRETVAMYTLKVGAIDTGSPPQTGTAEVHILVQDINDNGPVFDPPNVVGYVTENEPPMTSVMLLSATDPDLPPNGAPFTYHLVGGKHKDMVQVDRHTGLVKTTRSIDREATPELHVEVEVQDSGKPRMKSQYPITIVVLDKNDSPSSARGAHVLVHTFNDALPVGKIADIHPNDPDTSGQYQCKIVNGQQHGFSISAGCDLHTLKVHPGSEYILSVSGNDGQHSDVMSTVTVSFISFDNATVENSLTLRVENMTATKFLSHFYKSFVDLLKSTFDAIDSPYLFSIHGKDGGLELTIAIKGAKGYRSKAKVAETLSQKRNAIQQLLQTSSVSIGYSPCKKSTCENGGSCSEGIHVYEDTEISDSQALIFTSPLVSHDFSCRCQEGFTGKRCDKRQDPCSPNPCQFGGTCRRQGFDFQCSCPPLYDGKLCEIERSNVCDDNPCKNGGSCRETPDGSFFCLCRPGYRGNQCEAAADSCRPNPCLNGGLCVSLKPGYKCNCPDMYYGTHCEKSTFGFNELSYMVFPPLDANTNDISLIFSTSKPNSLLVYNFGVQTGGRSDFVAIELLDGKPTFSYGGARTAITSISVSTYVANGEWYKITATRNGRVVSLGVTACTDHGDICKDCKPGDKNCYADDIGPSGTLNFNNQPMYLGGLMTADPILERPGQVNTDDFVGCIHSVAINGRPLNLSSPARSQGIDTTCPRMKSICTVDLQDQCGLGGHCLDRWRTSSCLCSGGIYAPNCDEAFEPVSLGDGGFLEFRVSKKHRRMQLLEGLYDGTTLWKRPSSKIRRQRSWLRDASAATSVQSPQKKVSIMFRTMQKRGLLFYAATNNDFTSVEILDGQVKYVSRLGAGNPVNMTVPGSQVSDGSWHNLTIYSHNRGLRMLLDGSRVGDELDSAGVHDFLDPYLTTISLGGARRELYLAADGVPAFEGCLANFSINGEIQPFNGSGSILEEVVQVGKVSQGCLRSIVGAAAAPDPLSIGITLVIVFFVILLVAILISFVVFRLRRQKKEKGQGHPKQNGSALLAGSGGGGGGGDGTRSHPDPSGFLENGEVTSDVLRGHLSQEMVAKKYKEREVTERPQRPDIIEREVVNKSPGIQMRVVDDGHETSGVGGIADSEIPEHYDLENASSIAPSDIDIVYHYKGYRDGNVRKYKTNPHLPPNYHHKHGHRHSPHNFPPPQSAPPPTHHRESPRNLLRQSPNPVPPPRDSPNVLKMQTTPLARLSPSSELSQQTPRILTLQDISGKPLQSALLATSQGTGVKDVLTNSERSLNSPVSHLSQSSGSVHASSQGGGTKKRKPGTVDTGGASAGVTAGGAVNSAAAASAGVVAIGLTAEEIERLNSRPRNSSLVSTLDAVSSSSDDPRHERGRRRKDQLAELLETNTEILDPHDSSTTDESGNDSFTCSEFEYDNGGYEKRDFTPGDVIFSKLAEAEDENDQESESAKPYDGFDSFRGSLSTLVASDDDLSNMSPYRPPNGSALGWDYLLNWGPNFESLVGVFKDIAELPDTTSSRVAASLRLPNSAPKPSEEYV